VSKSSLRPFGSLLCLALAVVGKRASADELTQCVNAHAEAQLLAKQGKLLSAKARYTSCKSTAGCPAEVRGSCSELLSEVQAQLPSVLVEFRDSRGEEWSAARLEIDGIPRNDGLNGLPIELDPGSHVFAIDAGAHGSARVRVLLLAGARGRRISLRAPRLPERTHVEEPGGMPASAWILGSVGAVSLVTGAVFGALALHERSELESRCPCTESELGDDYDRMRRLGVAADVAFVGGAVLVGVAVVLAVSSKRPRPPVTGLAF
jgi:hypothetical protein